MPSFRLLNPFYSQPASKMRLWLGHKQAIAVSVSIFAGLVFVLLSAVRLDAQGLYYDEVFQAASSFAYVGQSAKQFVALAIRNIPIMNMPYIGAIKTAIYGLFLRFSGQAFGVVSWRLVGIICVALGIFSFGLIVRKKLPSLGLFTFLFLLITDLTVMLTTRFDWGPVALALFFRLILIAVWIEGELSIDLRAGNTFWMGALFGISLFEKLSSVVLLVPLLLMMCLSFRRRNKRHLGALLVGVVAGLSPLIVANLYTYVYRGNFISLQLQGMLQHTTRSLPDFLKVFKEYLSLGGGEGVERFILGVSQPIFILIEAVLLASILVFMIVRLIVTARRVSLYFRLSSILLLSYFSMIVSIYFLPALTSTHHWVIATPFQYAAIALFLVGFREHSSIKPAILYRIIFTIPVGLLVISRLIGLSFLEQSFFRGDASYEWDPSLTAMGEFAAAQSDQAIFIAADWGVANQMICFLNGKPAIVNEIYAEDQNSIDQIINIMHDAHTPDVYIVFHNPPYFVSSNNRNLLIHEIGLRLGEEWIIQSLDPQVAGLKSVILYKYSRVSH